jgi:L-2,4-diaminobutyric acid acetyltransferase
MQPSEAAHQQARTKQDVGLKEPTVEDGTAMWRIARDSRTLDLNSAYAYVLWARDFAATSVLATVGGRPAGFLTGYVRPDEPTTLMVWQVAVDSAFRGRRLAARMLDHVVSSAPRCTHVETTITADNAASIALFTSFAQARGAAVERTPLFTEAILGGGHDTEHLFRIGPVTTAA